jgi:hypothetical protein
MILSDKFVFIHLPKTGGSFVRELLTHYAPAAWHVTLHDNHPTIRDIPATHSDLPIFGLVRNPFDWYVSWYHYLKQHRSDPFFNHISQQGKLDFKSTIRAAFEVDIGAMYGFPCEFSRSPFGCYMNYMFGNDLNRLLLGKMETLRGDLRRILKTYDALTETLAQQIDSFPVVNVSDHLPYRDYYDEALKALISSRDREVLERFDYTF